MDSNKNPIEKKTFDVVICGGGLAGLTLARQLKLSYPEIRIMILEKSTFPLPTSTAKVGESTVEISSFYFGHVLQLQDYFKNGHFKKLGFRFFTGKQKDCFSDRPEIGLSSFPMFDSFQMDRGKLENDLYRMNLANGIEILTGVRVTDIQINTKGLHAVQYKLEGPSCEINSHWVVDAMGRRTFLQKKLDFKVAAKEKFSSVWFRVKGRLDIEDFVSDSNHEWHNRVPHRVRYFSTNHILGKGYWIWLIPLQSGNTSIGIVSNEKILPFQEYYNYENALSWMRQNEPTVASFIEGKELLDFVKLRNYSYSSSKVFSEDRWACIGEAAMFPDPYYSPGSNLIGFENLIVGKMFGLDKAGHLESEEVARFNHFVISLNENYTQTIHSSYSYFDQAQVQSLSYLWDLVIGWALLLPQMFNFIFLDKEKDRAVRLVSNRLLPILIRLEEFFKEWASFNSNRLSFKYIDYLAIPFIKDIYNRNLQPEKSITSLVADAEKNLNDIEEFAQVIFMIAVEDVYPEKSTLFQGAVWLNAAAVSLDYQNWEVDGLFSPSSLPRNLDRIRNQIRPLYRLSENGKEKETVSHDFNFSFQ